MKIEKVEKLVANLHDKTEYVIHIRNLKQGIMQFLEKIMKNVRKHRDIKLSQHKEEETIWCQNQIIILQSFSQKIYYQ